MPAPERASYATQRTRAIVLGATFCAYANSLGGPFQFDDTDVIVNASSVHSWSAYRENALHGLRPLLRLVYTACYTLGLGPIAFHVFNLLVHLLNVTLVMRLCSAALERGTQPHTSRPSPAVMATGLVFGLHPIHTEAVTYISGGSAALVTSFVLLALLAYVHGARNASGGLAWRMLSLALFLCAVLTKETAIVLPFGLLFWELCIERSRPRAVLAHLAPFFFTVLVMFVVLVMHPAYFELLYAVTGTRPLLDAVMSQVAGAGYLVSRLVLAQPLCIDPGLFLRPPTPLEIAWPAVLLLGLLALAWKERIARPVVAFGLAFLVFFVLFPYALLPRLDVVNERHMYLANVGTALALGAVWRELWERTSPHAKRVLLPIAAVLVCVLLALTLHRNHDYHSELSLWKSTLSAAPANPRAHNNLGVAYERRGELGAAEDAYRAALALEPRFAAARSNLARVERRR